ncbi:MAG: hypothetical protein ACOWWH_13145, partial [Eubacteriaceae bacterium]
MKRFIILMFLILLLIFSSACTVVSYTNISYQNQTENINEKYQKTSIEEFINIIGKNKEQVIYKYGEADLEDYLYGGQIYYYKNYNVAFGIDNNVVSSLIIYEGIICQNIKIGSKLIDIVNILGYKMEDINKTEYNQDYIL